MLKGTIRNLEFSSKIMKGSRRRNHSRTTVHWEHRFQLSGRGTVTSCSSELPEQKLDDRLLVMLRGFCSGYGLFPILALSE